MKNGFDRLAKPYRWMEYLTFGHALERCRFSLLPCVTEAKRALLIGDGDGRFAARLLKSSPRVTITAVDASAAMLQALQKRCNEPERVAVLQLELAKGSLAALASQRFDLVATHFFLDCLSDAQIEQLVSQIKPLLTPEARWIVSEFQVPRGPMRLPAWLLVRCLYAGFRVLTGLRVQHLPDHRRILQTHGFACTVRQPLLRGVLIAEEWQLLKEAKMN